MEKEKYLLNEEDLSKVMGGLAVADAKLRVLNKECVQKNRAGLNTGFQHNEPTKGAIPITVKAAGLGTAAAKYPKVKEVAED